MNSTIIIFTALFTIVFFLFPIWVAIDAWRKDYKTLAIIIGVSFLIPLIPQLIAIVAFFIVKPYQPNWNYIPNPQIYVGCGTKFYGATNRNSDNSFITTQWFCILYIPILPIQSYRVIYHGGDTTFQGAVITSFDDYSIIENLRISIKQVVQAYVLIFSFFIFSTSIFIFLNFIPKNSNVEVEKMSELGTSAVIGLLIVYVIIGYYLFRAK